MKVKNKSIKESLVVISENQSEDYSKVIYSLASKNKKLFGANLQKFLIL